MKAPIVLTSKYDDDDDDGTTTLEVEDTSNCVTYIFRIKLRKLEHWLFLKMVHVSEKNKKAEELFYYYLN